MTQITEDQLEQFRTTAERATAKLQAFRDGLTADEQTILSLALWQVIAEAAGTDGDVVGFANNAQNPVVKDLAKEVGKTIAIDLIYSGLKAAWGWLTAPSDAKWPGPPSAH